MPQVFTHRRSIPWSWMGWVTVPWVTMFYLDNVSNSGPLTFTLRRFVENPSLIALLTSLNLAFNFLVGAATSYMSDRIWTRWGRRRPFLIVGWTGAAACMACIPMVEGKGALIVLVVLYHFFADIAKPVEPLYNEVVPSAQRGRAAIVRTVGQSLMGVFFFGVLLAHFDDPELVRLPHGFTMSGEQALYWTGVLLALVGVGVLLFVIREAPPAGEIHREEFRLRVFLRDLFANRQWWTLYALYAAPCIASPGLDQFRPLLSTEQLGFTKAQIGWSATLGMIVSLVLFVPLAGFLTDRVSRLRLFQIGLVGPALVNLVFFLYLRYVADYTVPLAVFIAFGLVGAALSTCLHFSWGPLIYDYIPSAKFGTVSAGFVFISGVVPFAAINIAGGWVNAVSRWIGTPGGGKYDYSSLYVLQLFGTAAAWMLTLYFAREERLGRLIPYGRQELAESAGPARPAQ